MCIQTFNEHSPEYEYEEYEQWEEYRYIVHRAQHNE